ncbi:MAG: hypothetical protein KAS32_13085 [Candidatus Peribacteraceae bacterium]|nr:hypothetical protein [Candidatus Peribacteraceae bacterium]
MAEEKTQTSEEITEEEKAKETQETKTETETQTSTETTEKEKDWEQEYKNLHSGTTPKLQELSRLKKEKEFTDKLLEQIGNKGQDSTQDELVSVDDEIRQIDSELKSYRDAGFQNDSYEIKGLMRAKRLAINQKKNDDLNSRIAKKYDQDADLGKFMMNHKDFEDYDGLATIIAEAEAEGDKISFSRAYKIWKGDHSEKVTSQKTKEALALKEKADKARSTTDGDVIEAKTEDDDLVEFRSAIAPIDTIN